MREKINHFKIINQRNQHINERKNICKIKKQTQNKIDRFKQQERKYLFELLLCSKLLAMLKPSNKNYKIRRCLLVRRVRTIKAIQYYKRHLNQNY